MIDVLAIFDNTLADPLVFDFFPVKTQLYALPLRAGLQLLNVVLVPLEHLVMELLPLHVVLIPLTVYHLVVE